MKPVRLGDVAALNPKWNRSARPDDPVSFVGMASMSDVAGETVGEEHRTVDQVRKGYTPFERDDLLIAKITPCFENGKIGRASIKNQWGAGSTEFHVVRPGPELDGSYALHFLRGPRFRSAGELRMTGSGGQRRVPAAYIADFQLPLPSIEEQRRIAAILDKADELRTKRRQTIAHLDALTQSIFHAIFDNGAQSFESATVADVASVQGGLQVTSKRDALENKAPYLRVANVYRGWLDLQVIKEIGLTETEFDRTALKRGDLLIVEGHGNPQEIGRCAVWNEEVAGCVHQNHLIRVRVDSDKLVPLYAMHFLNSASGRQFLLRGSNTTSGLNTISTSTVKACPVRVPSLELQRTFATRVAAVERLKETHRKHLVELDALFASLQSRAFKGEL